MKKTILLFFIFLKMGLLAFGGGIIIVALSKAELTEKRRWLKNTELLDFFAISQTLPGIMAVNFALFAGNKIAGFWGGLAALTGVLTPAVLAILILARLITTLTDYPLFIHALAGVQIAVIAMILEFTVRQSKSALTSPLPAGLAFLTGLWSLCALPPAIPLIGAGFLGAWYYHRFHRILR